MRAAKRVAVACSIGAVLVGLVAASAIAQPRASATSLFITKVTSTPGGRGPLDPHKVNAVVVGSKFSFRVGLRNGAIQRNTKVTLTITRPKSPYGPIVKKKTVSLQPNAHASLKFDRLDVLFAQRVTLKVRVDDPQRRETWSRSYPVVFALG